MEGKSTFNGKRYGLEIRNNECRYINYRQGKRIGKRRKSILQYIIGFKTSCVKIWR